MAVNNGGLLWYKAKHHQLNKSKVYIDMGLNPLTQDASGKSEFNIGIQTLSQTCFIVLVLMRMPKSK